jgi:hypothetical protein
MTSVNHCIVLEEISRGSFYNILRGKGKESFHMSCWHGWIYIEEKMMMREERWR